MTIVQRTIFTKNITAIVDEVLAFGSRGGILLYLEMIWQPYTYINKSTENETVWPGTIQMIALDTATARSPIGQVNASFTNGDYITIPTSGSWTWAHPDINYITPCSVVSKLKFNNSFTTDPAGVIRGNLQLRMRADPTKLPLIGQSMQTVARFMAFDSAVS